MAGPNQDIVGRAFEIVSDKTQIEAGESVSFLVSYVEQRVEEGDINLYINNNFIESIPFGPSPISFDYVFRESGTFFLYVTQTNVEESNEVVITVNDTFVQPQGLVSWRINNKMVSSLEMNNKEIQSIVTSDNVVLYNIKSYEYNAISLSSDKNILSYADNESCTLTAQLTKNGSPSLIEGETVSFYNGATLLGTDDTDSNGIATLTYTSAGVGDMSITASVDGIIISETFSIRDFTYIADTMEKLATALINVTTGNSIYLKDGTYSLPSNYTVSGIKLIGESTNAKIVSSDGQINFTDSIVDTIGMETVNVNRPVIYVDGTTTVKNCDCVSNLKPWDATVIKVNLNNPNGLITIHNCYFHGDAKSNGFGHSCSAITGEGSVAYNVIIHHNTFNHPCNSGQLHGGNKGKAVCFYNGGSTTGTLNNVHLYCNEYLGCGDTNITVSEEICPDN